MLLNKHKLAPCRKLRCCEIPRSMSAICSKTSILLLCRIEAKIVTSFFPLQIHKLPWPRQIFHSDKVTKYLNETLKAVP